MKSKGIVIFLVILGIVIVAIIAGDYISTRPDKQPGNPYELNLNEFREVDPKLILFTETKNFRISPDSLNGLSYHKGILYLTGDKKLQMIDKSGRLTNEISLTGTPSCVHATAGKIFVGLGNRISVYSPEGTLIAEWPPISDSTYLTSLASKGDHLFIADAGKRVVYHYRVSGEKIGEINGKTDNDALHGFVIPSPNFDLAFDPDGELWIVNPGNHSLENYSPDGSLRGFWKNSAATIDGFYGCCNPAHIAFLPNGNFVTCEKGMIRIKIYKPSGDFLGVVAPPSKFTEGGHPCDLAVDEAGVVYALDKDKKAIRIFEENSGL